MDIVCYGRMVCPIVKKREFPTGMNLNFKAWSADLLIGKKPDVRMPLGPLLLVGSLFAGLPDA